MDGAFNDFSIVIGMFCSWIRNNWQELAKKALEKKGFRVQVVNDEKEFIDLLEKKNIRRCLDCIR